MNIQLPIKIDNSQISIETKCIVVIGANGSGKTRFGSDIEKRFNQKTHRISAQKSLSMPKEVSPKSKFRAEQEFLYGYYEESTTDNIIYKIGQRWGQNPNTYLLNDYEKLMVLLHTEEYEESINFKESYSPGQATIKPVTKLDRVKQIWEYVLPHRKLQIKAGSIETSSSSNTSEIYNAAEMSDGERVVFYLIGEVISAPTNSIIIIDEPEMHIHKSITKKLWDKIEQERTDCTFIYLTHDIDFASSRQNATRIWAKSFNGSKWDYEILEENDKFPEQVYYEILGSRKPILFIEGDESSIDYKLLQLIFDDYTTKPLGGCQKVIETTKSFNEHNGFHHISSFGLIDRDRRTEEEIAHLNCPEIWIAGVAEIENFLLIEEVVREVATNMMKDANLVFEAVKSNVISFFDSQKEKQALEHSLARAERILKNTTDNKAVKTIDDLENELTQFFITFKIKDIYTEVLNYFQELIDNKNYNEILKIFNNKGLVHNSQVIALCDLNTKNDAYLNYIIGILKLNNEKATRIKQAIIQKIKK
jgi:ABC-type cobalamin/Fe3+-siderophores transport system ATPase subunit